MVGKAEQSTGRENESTGTYAEAPCEVPLQSVLPYSTLPRHLNFFTRHLITHTHMHTLYFTVPDGDY